MALPFSRSAAALLAGFALVAPALADPVKIVAAENFYGDMATQVGGANVIVTSILNNPIRTRTCSKPASRPPKR